MAHSLPRASRRKWTTAAVPIAPQKYARKRSFRWSFAVIVNAEDGTVDTYDLPKFMRSNQGTCINHKPLVAAGQEVAEGQVLAPVVVVAHQFVLVERAVPRAGLRNERIFYTGRPEKISCAGFDQILRYQCSTLAL